MIDFASKYIFLLTTLTTLSLLAGCQSQDDEQSTSSKHSGAMVLAISWQAGFCETRPRLRECKSQKSWRYDVTHFSLHGLWPQPRRNAYCGVSESEINKDKKRRWKRLEGLSISSQLKQDLIRIMPGTRSYLHRHEWVKHGTCYSKSAETYFADSLILMDAINGSKVQRLFADNIGRRLSNNEIRKAFDDAFGQGVGDRVRVACKRDGNRTIITEITLGIKGTVTADVDIGKLALASPTTNAGCPAGIVDAVGLQ
ncbi:MAG: ribonuclease [Rhizobiaceae bacterium]